MEEPYTTNAIQFSCGECDLKRLQLILLEQDESKYLLSFICLSCGVYQVFELPFNRIFNLETIKPGIIGDEKTKKK